MVRKLKLDPVVTSSYIAALDTDEGLIQKLKCTEVELEKIKAGDEHFVLKYALQISKAYNIGFEAFIGFETKF